MPEYADHFDRLNPGVWKTVSVAVLGSFLAQLDATVVNVSLGSLAVELHSSLQTIQWVTSGYLLALALMLPLNGWLVERIGTKRLYLFCFSGFTLSSALCALSWSADSLIGFRVLQGISGGLMAPLTQLMIARAAGKHMVRVMGYVAVPVLLGPIVGPVVAGAILQHESWRWLFLINLPIGVLAIVLASWFLPADDNVRCAWLLSRIARRAGWQLSGSRRVFAAVGYEATTMQAIADRSDSSIGALYNYFPDKESVAATLRQQYSEDLQSRVKSIMVESTNMSVVRFAESFFDCITDFVQDRPAWLNLVAAPISLHRAKSARNALRSTIADAFRSKNPFLSPERALLAANVAVQIVKGMRTLWGETEAKSRDLVAAEFRKLLTSYLQEVLCERERAKS